MTDDDDDSIPNHKLSGFLLAVLSVEPNQPHLPLLSPCHVGSDSGFLSQNGVVLSPLDSVEFNSSNSHSSRKGRGKRRPIGGVGGNVSVIHQLRKLVNHKCLSLISKVVSVVTNDCEEIRAVVMVDVYLPVAVWSGWQFPRSSTGAAALFRHLSCDWENRLQLLVNAGNICQFDDKDIDSIWNLSDCHVLGCKLHCSAPDASRRKLFDLHEIFNSLPRLANRGVTLTSRVNSANSCCESGIYDLSDDLLAKILIVLAPIDLFRVSATCHHLRLLAVSIMPCMKLKLFPHQQAAVEWMLQRERGSEWLPHPLYRDYLSVDGFPFYMDTVSGEIVTGLFPKIRDFRGGMFCDEPGLGKTITALSVILKTQGTMAVPPDGVQVFWCKHNNDHRCGYYEVNGVNFNRVKTLSSETVLSRNRRRQSRFSKLIISENQKPLQKVVPSLESATTVAGAVSPCDLEGCSSPVASLSTPGSFSVHGRRSYGRIKRNLLHAYDGFDQLKGRKVGSNSSKRKHASPYGLRLGSSNKQFGQVCESVNCSKKPRKPIADHFECNETWVQCDACRKWRKLADASIAVADSAWFCSMNSNPMYRSCKIPEESWVRGESVTCLPGFHKKGTPGGEEENVSFFTSVLKEHYALINLETENALTWLVKLSPDKLSKMETIGLVRPVLDTRSVSKGGDHEFHKIFLSFGLTKKEEKGSARWYYPRNLQNLELDLAALRIALCEPLDSMRLYLSRATLIVVPSNLVDHWITQIQKHVRSGQLRVYAWTDHQKPCSHNLAWDYDVVITTFNRLSAEWTRRHKSALMQVHWYRVMLDEGHTLGSSLNLTNKLQLLISLTAANRWLLTGTPTPNTPNSQVSHLYPLLRFLGEEAYGKNQKSWEAGIHRPFEAQMEEGRSRLLELLHRCMISARKIDLQTIPPCIKKVKFLDFTEEHAKSYNELVATVRRNILMADWNDPSHVESLLNTKQWKFRSNTIRNVRLSCCVAGHIKVTHAGEDIQETMDLLVENDLDPQSEEYDFIKYNLMYGGTCMRCEEWCRLPVITPCRHLLCLHCVSLDSEKCTFPGCNNLYEMQSPEILTRPENPNPKWPVPKDLIELQPSYKQDDWDPDWQSTSSSKVAYVVDRLKELQEANQAIALSENDNDRIDTDSLDVLLFQAQPNQSSKTLPEKVIIFSQFLEHIHIVEQQLTSAGIRFVGMYSPMHSVNKMKSLATFQHDASCLAVLMDGSAALGLDLSFVTHVFLMEPIWDRSMEEQVISRAHRMGATRPVHVETLAMRGTVEEQMLQFLQDADERRWLLKEEFKNPDQEGSRPQRTLHDFAESSYLAHLRFVHTHSK